jgi:hypothetical protein
MPKPDTVKKALDAIKRRADYEYFFSKLKSPTWLKPLWDAGLFRHPPSPVRDGKYISLPFWPESQYLARVAASEPDLVLKITLEIPQTENSRVHEDLIEAALRMPAAKSAELAKRIKTWTEISNLSYLADKLGSLISHLARGGQESAALELTRTVLIVIPGEEVDANLPAGIHKWRRDPQARFDNWYYEKILKENIPDLVRGCGEKALMLLCELLDSAMQNKRSHNGDDASSDYSYIWRPAIEDHSQNQPHGLATMLVSAVRDAAETIVKSSPRKVAEVVSGIERYKGSIYQRIGMHLLRMFPDTERSQIKARLLDREQFNDIGLQHEYVLLLQSQFEKLSSDEQNEILGWIETGPDRVSARAHETEITPKDQSDEESRRYVLRWQLERLAPLREVLPEKWKKRYEEGVREFGAPKHPEFAAYMTSASGPTSPKTEAELRSMSVDEIAKFLTDWRPPKEHWDYSPEGLGRELATVVSSEPQKFAAEIQRFINIGPYAATYVRNILSGLREATAQKRTFSWPTVIDLCDWVVQQPRDPAVKESGHLDHDPHWGWTRKTIADLLERGFQEGPNEIPLNLRKQTWNVLEPITDDPEPTPDYETKYGGSNMDPATMSINTARGEAMHAVILYGLWIRRHIEKEADAEARLSRGFDEMPEVKQVLDTHLTKDLSLAIRSVYGRFFPWLYLIDPGWAQTNIINIFPTNDSRRPFYDAAWNTYIVFCQPFNNVFDILKPVYAHAVNQLDEQLDEKAQAYDPDHHLTEHLATFYWRGKITPEDDGGLLELFWTKASPKLRGYLFEYVGRSLFNTKGDIPTEVTDRLKHLWENRLARAKASSNPEQYKEELADFSWCFIADKFDDEWSIKQLAEVLRLVNKIDDPRFVVERLAILANSHAATSVECLRLIVGSELENWEIYSWRKEAKEILQIAIQCGEQKARETAIDLVHRLGAMGYLEFRDVLPKLDKSGA